MASQSVEELVQKLLSVRANHAAVIEKHSGLVKQKAGLLVLVGEVNNKLEALTLEKQKLSAILDENIKSVKAEIKELGDGVAHYDVTNQRVSAAIDVAESHLVANGEKVKLLEVEVAILKTDISVVGGASVHNQ